MRRVSKLSGLCLISFTQFLIFFSPRACSQPVGELVASSDKPLQQSGSINREPKIEFYNWLYGSSRGNWFEWHTVTASMISSLIESGFRLRGMGGIGGYADDIEGEEAENTLASAYSVDDNFLPTMGTVGKLYGMNGFGGLQLGYTHVAESWKISAFVGASVVRIWAVETIMMTEVVKFARDLATLKGTKYGVLASIEGEYHPTDKLMFSAWGIYTPAYKWGYFELKSGVSLPFGGILPKEILENAYVGPHVALNVSDGLRQPMFGAHLTGITLGPVYMSITSGYTHEQLTGKGIYSILETSMQF